MEDLRYLQLSMAEHLFEQKKYTSAAHSLSDLLDSEPDNVAVRLLLVRAYYHSPARSSVRGEGSRRPRNVGSWRR